MNHFLDIIFFRPVFRKEKERKTWADIEEHYQDGLKIFIGFELWACIILLVIGLII